MTYARGVLVLCWTMLVLNGCSAIGAIAANAARGGTHDVAAQVRVLEGKSFALLVQADRSVQGENPLLVEHLTQRMVERLADPAVTPLAAGYVPPQDVLRYTYDTPSWPLKGRAELGKALGDPERIIVVELLEYRLHDPGNAYVWDGRASATVSVFDPTSTSPDLALVEKTVTVKFPDSQGQGMDEMNVKLVNSALAQRLIDRATWLFLNHEEPNEITY